MYVVLNSAIWHLFTHQFTDPTYYVGDLARISYLAQYAQPRQRVNTLPKRHISYDAWNGEAIDLITIGDSFSGGGGSGSNSFYQDWIATQHNLSVMNLPKLSDTVSSVETAYILLNSGFLDELSPKALLLQDVARKVVKKHGGKVHTDQQWSSHQIKSVYSSKGDIQSASDSDPKLGNLERLISAISTSKPKTQRLSYSFLNSGNMKFLLNQLLYIFDDNAISSQVYRMSLKRSHFSKDTGNTLLIYFEDIQSVFGSSDESVAIVTQNLNDLATALERNGIALYYMPAVDKFDAYYDEILEPRYPRNPLFEELRKYPRTYHLVDTQVILGAGIAEGEKDIFFLDDTHWTWKAAKRISRPSYFHQEPIPRLSRRLFDQHGKYSAAA